MPIHLRHTIARILSDMAVAPTRQSCWANKTIRGYKMRQWVAVHQRRGKVWHTARKRVQMSRSLPTCCGSKRIERLTRTQHNSCWQIGGSRLLVFAKFLGSRSFNGFACRPSAPTDDAWSTGFQIIEWSLYGKCPVIQLTQPQRLASFLRNCKIEIPATLSPYPQIIDNMLAVNPVELVRTWERAIQILTSGETGPSTELVQVGHRCWMIS